MHGGAGAAACSEAASALSPACFKGQEREVTQQALHADDSKRRLVHARACVRGRGERAKNEGKKADEMWRTHTHPLLEAACCALLRRKSLRTQSERCTWWGVRGEAIIRGWREGEKTGVAGKTCVEESWSQGAAAARGGRRLPPFPCGLPRRSAAHASPPSISLLCPCAGIVARGRSALSPPGAPKKGLRRWRGALLLWRAGLEEGKGGTKRWREGERKSGC